MKDLTNDFAWSWSRNKSFYECPRQLYWRHYGSWNGWLEDAPRDAQLAYRLKQIKSLGMLVGDVFHEVVSEVLALREPGPKPVPIQQLHTDMERRLLKRIRESRNRDWERYGQPKRYTILFEDYYHGGVTPAEATAARADLHACVDGFAQGVYGRRAFAAPRDRIIVIDPKNFDERRFMFGGVLVYASPDLVAMDEAGNAQIIDWKTGLRPDKAQLAQLAVYGLYVSERFGLPLHRMTTHLVYVRTGDVEKHADLAAGADEVRRMIDTYVGDVRGRLTDPAANVAGDIELFPMTEDRRSCRRCNFRELCGRMEGPSEPPQDDGEPAA